MTFLHERSMQVSKMSKQHAIHDTIIRCYNNKKPESAFRVTTAHKINLQYNADFRALFQNYDPVDG